METGEIDMWSWLKHIAKGAWFVGLAWFVSLSHDAWASSNVLQPSEQLGQLEQSFAQKSMYVKTLYRLRQKQILEVEEAARRLAFIKEQAQRSGILGLPARMRLPGERAAAESLVQNIERLDRKLARQTQFLQTLREQLRTAYRQHLTRWQEQVKRTVDISQRKNLREQWKRYYQRLVRLNQGETKMVLRPVPRLEVNIDPLDGPDDLKQKADVLKDQEDRLIKQIQQIRSRITQLRSQEQREKTDRRLEQRVGEMLAEDELFNEGERNPRVTTGSRTSERMRNRASANAVRLFGATGKTGTTAGSQTPQAGSVSESTAKSPDRSTTPPVQGAAPGTQGTQGATDSTKAGGTSTGTSGTNAAPGTSDPKASFSQDSSSKTETQTGTPVNPVTPSATLQPRVGNNTMIPSGDPMNPQGTLSQQMQVLRKYQRDLHKQIQELRKKQQQFLDRAKSLKEQESRRPHR